MSKQVKSMLIDEYRERLDGLENAALISLRGIDSNSTNEIRKALREKEVRITIVQNSLARKAIKESGLEGLGALMEGPTAMAYGAESVVDVTRELCKLIEKFPGIELKGAILDGMLFEGDAGVKRLSKFPTRDEAIAQVVTLIVSPGRNLLGQIKGPGAGVAGLIKAIETKLEKGEAIARVG